MYPVPPHRFWKGEVCAVVSERFFHNTWENFPIMHRALIPSLPSLQALFRNLLFLIFQVHNLLHILIA